MPTNTETPNEKIDTFLIENFILGMKSREDEARKLSDEHLARATTIQSERMKLEQYLYELKQASQSGQKNPGICRV